MTPAAAPLSPQLQTMAATGATSTRSIPTCKSRLNGRIIIRGAPVIAVRHSVTFSSFVLGLALCGCGTAPRARRTTRQSNRPQSTPSSSNSRKRPWRPATQKSRPAIQRRPSCEESASTTVRDQIADLRPGSGFGAGRHGGQHGHRRAGAKRKDDDRRRQRRHRREMVEGGDRESAPGEHEKFRPGATERGSRTTAARGGCRARRMSYLSPCQALPATRTATWRRATRAARHTAERVFANE